MDIVERVTYWATSVSDQGKAACFLAGVRYGDERGPVCNKARGKRRGIKPKGVEVMLVASLVWRPRGRILWIAPRLRSHGLTAVACTVGLDFYSSNVPKTSSRR